MPHLRSSFIAATALALSGALACGCTTGMTMDDRDAGGSPIIDGGFVCIYAEAVACLDNVHYSCAPDGEFLSTVQLDCTQQLVDEPARPSVCVAEIGCALCFPNNAFCVG